MTLKKSFLKMGRKSQDVRERFYDVRTGNYNLRWKHEGEVFSRSFALHQKYLQNLLNRIESKSPTGCTGPKEIVTLVGVFEEYVIPLYCGLQAANRERLRQGLAALPQPEPVWEPFDHTWDVFLSRPLTPPVAEWMIKAGKDEAKRLCGSTRDVRFKSITDARQSDFTDVTTRLVDKLHNC